MDPETLILAILEIREQAGDDDEAAALAIDRLLEDLGQPTTEALPEDEE